jgi:CheY-like chemotaxis protein
VVIISADAMQHQLDKLLKAGAARYLTKPLDITELLNTIDEMLKK